MISSFLVKFVVFTSTRSNWKLLFFVSILITSTICIIGIESVINKIKLSYLSVDFNCVTWYWMGDSLALSSSLENLGFVLMTPVLVFGFWQFGSGS